MGCWNIMYNASKMQSKVFLDCKDDSSSRQTTPQVQGVTKGSIFIIESIGHNNFTLLYLQLGISRFRRRWADHPRTQLWVRTSCSFRCQRRCRRPFECLVRSQSICLSRHVWLFQLRCIRKSVLVHRETCGKSFESLREQRLYQGIQRRHQDRVVLKNQQWDWEMSILWRPVLHPPGCSA